MSSLFNLKIPSPEKVVSRHPWERVVKDVHASNVKYAHNSVKNPQYPKKEEKKKAVEPEEPRVRFTLVGNRVTKEFIYCDKLVKGLHKYRQNKFNAPIIRGVTSVEWPLVLNDLKLRYGELAFCLRSQVAVIMDDTFLGGETELKELVESKYIYHLKLDYYKESVNQFAAFVRSSGRPCAYFHFSIDKEEVGTMIFMLYSDIVPYTCDNFLRLCKQTKGGYGGTPVHRIVKDGWIQCGGFGLKDNKDLGCENFIVPHDRRGVLCMANDGRHVDCSTQFFILLQPAMWMAYKYVAFGQLIDGESTLKKIEQVPTFYESPRKEIIIFKSGIFNMDCQDITVNKKANEYIFGHIEDLYVIGEIFYDELMERVFAEIDRKKVQPMMGEEMEDEGDLLKDSKRFMQNKEDIEKQLKKSQAMQPVLEQETEVQVHEEYEYEYEGGTPYKHESIATVPSLVVKPEKPFYLPLTDVPYPDETDSTFDLRKFVRGDYCLESDLLKKAPDAAKPTKISYPSEVFSRFESSSSEDSTSLELDSDEEKEIKNYLSQNVDRVSFAGGIVRHIARGIAKHDIFENASDIVITDEVLRRVRTKSADITHTKHHKFPGPFSSEFIGRIGKQALGPIQSDRKISVSIADDYDKEHRQINRRPTGFVRPADLEKIRLIAKLNPTDEEEIEAEEKFEDDQNRHISVSITDDQAGKVPKKIKRRQTGFVKPTMLEKVHIFKNEDANDDDDRKVRIEPKTPSQDRGAKQSFRRTGGSVRGLEGDDIVIDVHRPSVLKRLYDDVAIDEDEEIPTLKDYKPKTEAPKKSFLLTATTDNLLRNESKEKYYRPSVLAEASEHENVFNLQHGKKVAHKISSDYVKTIDQVEHRQEASIRSVEFAKSRPAMSVTDYQLKNAKHQEEHKNPSKHQVKSHKPGEERGVGLRLPGDTPLYSNYSLGPDKSEAVKHSADDGSHHIGSLRSKLAKVIPPKNNT